jgi:tetratricopeptide (TPR) repeat protein
MMDAAQDDAMVVNVDHLMDYVKEQKAEGNAAFQKTQYTEALAAWQRGLDAIAQADGRPMRVDDMKLVLVVRSVLHSNRGQALMKMEFWRRAILDLDEAVRVDPQNVKAIWRRCKAHEALKQWSEAEADINLLLEPSLQANAGRLLEEAGLIPEQLEKERARLVEKRAHAEAVADETFEERAEEAAAKGLRELRERFEDVTARNGLHGNSELATEIADMLTRPGGVTTEYVANVFQISDEDADILIQWVRKACVIKDALAGQV